MKYLNDTGLTYFWEKIKSRFTTVENKIGTGSLDTTATTIIPAVNEVNARTKAVQAYYDMNTTGIITVANSLLRVFKVGNVVHVYGVLRITQTGTDKVVFTLYSDTGKTKEIQAEQAVIFTCSVYNGVSGYGNISANSGQIKASFPVTGDYRFNFSFICK